MLSDTPNTGIKEEFSFTKDVNVVSAVCMARTHTHTHTHTHRHAHTLFRKSSSLSSHSNCCACQGTITFRSESSLIRVLFMVMWRLWNTQQHTGRRLITGTGGALHVAPIDYFLSQWVTCLQNCSMSWQKPQSFSPCHDVQYTTYFPSRYFWAQHAARIVSKGY